MRRSCLAATALVALTGGLVQAQSFNTGQTAYLNWMNTLAMKKNGYAVTVGTVQNFPGCAASIAAFSTCFGNNPATPYILTQPPQSYPSGLPPWATQVLIPGSPPPFIGSAPSNPTNEQATNSFWQIGKDEAIVTIITLPPQGAYLGVQSYLLERDNAIYTDVMAPSGSTCTAGAPNGPHTEALDCNYIIFGNFMNTVNDMDIAQIPGFATMPPAAWNTYNDNPPPPYQPNVPIPTSFKTIAIITSPNLTLVAAMEGFFQGDPNTLFTETMPTTVAQGAMNPTLKLLPCTGMVSAGCDVFTTVIRPTLAANLNESTVWSTGNNILVYRVELPGVSQTPADLYDVDKVAQSYFPQSCNTNETLVSGATSPCVPAVTSGANLNADLQMVATVLARYGNIFTGDAYASFEASGDTAPMMGGMPPSSVNGGIGGCFAPGKNCAGGTQDTDYYRTYKAGSLKDLSPVFVVGVLHSTSPADFTPTQMMPSPAVNNADYTGISIADISTMFTNSGVFDAANPNSTSEFYVPPANRVMLGSAVTVLSYLHSTFGGNPNATLLSQLPTSVQNDLNNIYIHIFERKDVLGLNPNTACTDELCANVLANDVTYLIDGKAPASPTPGSSPPFMAMIPDNDAVQFTERGYVAPPQTGVAAQHYNFTGAAVQYLQSPYIVCDTVLSTLCGRINQ